MRDYVKITVRGGRGGDGLASFRREKYVPRGGPDGGDGGCGGNVIIAAYDKISTLHEIRNKGRYTAADGTPGGKALKSGRQGADLVIKVPLGTAVLDAGTGDLLADLVSPGDRVTAAGGGVGGRGNSRFATPQNRVPLEFEPGTEGEFNEINLAFSIPADVAVVGFPGAGKSSLVRALTRSRTAVGDYPFTTMQPHLGVCQVDSTALFRIIDMPALVEGSSQGRGIGNGFLSHLERVRLVIYLIDISAESETTPEKQLETLENEIREYDSEYLEKDRLVIFNKIDLAGEGAGAEQSAREQHAAAISALQKSGIEDLKRIIVKRLGLGDDE